MIILGIETSCDETALSLIEASGGLERPSFRLINAALFSQVDIHKQYGGVFPAIAKREHAKKLVPLLKKLLSEVPPLPTSTKTWHPSLLPEEGLREEVLMKLDTLLSREYDLLKEFLDFIPTIEKPDIDAIAVTYGPGLEPALWVGVNFAKALGIVWNIPVIPTNHMEGHIISPLMHASLLSEEGSREVEFPALALLISGGHTELVLAKAWGEYEIIGKTRDDAVGEAFDKVARILGLPYPGGPEVSKLAHEARENKYIHKFSLPRPMINSGDLDFSFSGIKTAVLYTVRDNPILTPEDKCILAREFEDAVTEVLLSKTKKVTETKPIKSLIIGGGVIANGHLRNAFTKLAQEENITLYIPDSSLATDNAIMIAMAGYISYLKEHHKTKKEFVAEGNVQLGN